MTFASKAACLLAAALAPAVWAAQSGSSFSVRINLTARAGQCASESSASSNGAVVQVNCSGGLVGPEATSFRYYIKNRYQAVPAGILSAVGEESVADVGAIGTIVLLEGGDLTAGMSELRVLGNSTEDNLLEFLISF